MTLVAGASSFAVGNAYQAQMPEFAADLGHGKADLYYSMLLAANAAGALTAGIVLESRGIVQASPKTAFVLMLFFWQRTSDHVIAVRDASLTPFLGHGFLGPFEGFPVHRQASCKVRE